MINRLQQVMLYVENVEESVKFWESIGFKVVGENALPEGFKSFEVKADKGETSFVIFDKEFIKKYSPMVSLETPSLMFNTDDIDALYNDFKEKGITVGELAEMPGMRVFNFADKEAHYFAVMQQL